MTAGIAFFAVQSSQKLPATLGKSCGFDRPDTSVAGISLNDAASALAVIRHIPFDSLIWNQDVPHANFRSSDGSEILTLFFFPGSKENEWSEFRITRTTGEAIAATLPMRSFLTSRGLRLGATERQVRRALGEPCDSNLRNGHQLMIYHYEDPDISSFIRRYNMPDYHALLEFEEGLLVDYRFGFDMP